MPMKPTDEPPRPPLPVIGWREWVALPDLGVPAIKAKIDTGARSSALHAWDVQPLKRGGGQFVRFVIHPVQRETETTIEAEAEVLEYRAVRTSGGHVSHRPVIVTHVELMGQRLLIELTLAPRDTMGFRMLLGREAFRRRFLVDAGRSYFGGRPGGPRRRRKSSRRQKDSTDG